MCVILSITSSLSKPTSSCLQSFSSPPVAIPRFHELFNHLHQAFACILRLVHPLLTLWRDVRLISTVLAITAVATLDADACSAVIDAMIPLLWPCSQIEGSPLIMQCRRPPPSDGRSVKRISLDELHGILRGTLQYCLPRNQCENQR